MKKIYINTLLLLLLLNVSLKPQTVQANDKVAEAIKYSVTPNTDKNIFPYSGGRVFKDAEYRLELSEAFTKASLHFDLPIGLLIAMGYRESVFRPHLTGLNGELGVMQVGEFGRRKCKAHCIEVDTVEGGIMCGACWLDMGKNWCKRDLIDGLYAYVAGKCKSDVPKTVRVVSKRLILWTRLARIIKQ